jgi:hypothetical protein
VYKLISSNITTVTPRKSEGFLQINTFSGQRPLIEGIAQRYGRAMADGRFRRGEVAVAICPDGSRVLMNGQHQCRGSVVSDASFKATVDLYKCPTWEDVWHLFGTFDVHRVRSSGNIMKAASGLFANEALRVLPQRLLNVCGGALAALGGGTKPVFKIPNEDRLRRPELVEQYADDVLRIASYPPDTIPFLRIPVVAAMIVTFRLNPEKAREFWDRVLLGDNLRRHSPQWRLRNALSVPSGKSLRNSTKSLLDSRVRAGAVYATCIVWWNTFLEGVDRHAVKIGAMKSLPEARAA